MSDATSSAKKKRTLEDAPTRAELEAGADHKGPTSSGVFQRASEEEMASRKIFKVKRKTETETTSSIALPKINFGAPSAEKNESTEKADGAAAAKEEKTPTGFSFGTPKAKDGESTPKSGFSFGGSSTFKGFSFGSGQGSALSFNFPKEKPAAAAGPGSIVADSAPASKFKEVDNLVSGEEAESIEHKAFGLLYELRKVKKPDSDEEKDEFCTCGKGELHLNTAKDGDKMRARMVMRTEKTQKVILNVAIYKDMPHTVDSERYVRFSGVDADDKLKNYVMMLKTKEEAQSVVDQLDRIIDMISTNE